jgi:hypothetical protein
MKWFFNKVLLALWYITVPVILKLSLSVSAKRNPDPQK